MAQRTEKIVNTLDAVLLEAVARGISGAQMTIARLLQSSPSDNRRHDDDTTAEFAMQALNQKQLSSCTVAMRKRPSSFSR